MKKIMLLCLMLGAVGLFLFACGDDVAAPVTDGGDDPGAAGLYNIDDGEGDADDIDADYIYDGLSGLDFGGRAFNIHAFGAEVTRIEFEAEELTGAVISDAIYHRNRAVEERLNVELNITFSGAGSAEVGAAAERNVRAGDHVNHVYYGHVMRMGQTALNNVFMDIYSLGHIDFSRPWWPQMAVENLTIGGRAILMVGEANLSFLLAAYGVFFNTQIAENGGLPPSELYRMVLDGEWTIERKTEIARNFAVDLTGGGGALTPDDQFGLMTTTGFAASAYMWGFGQMLVHFDREGMPELNLPNPVLHEIVQRIYDLYFHTHGVWSVPFDNSAWRYAEPLRNGNTFMINHYLHTALRLRDLETDFGILPYPKLHEHQERYFSVADGFHTAFAVPLTTPHEDFAFVGAVIESLNAETYRIVVPAYYDTALQLQGARDVESQFVMDMIRDGRLVDFGCVYDG